MSVHYEDKFNEVPPPPAGRPQSTPLKRIPRPAPNFIIIIIIVVVAVVLSLRSLTPRVHSTPPPSVVIAAWSLLLVSLVIVAAAAAPWPSALWIGVYLDDVHSLLHLPLLGPCTPSVRTRGSSNNMAEGRLASLKGSSVRVTGAFWWWKMRNVLGDKTEQILKLYECREEREENERPERGRSE